MGHLTMPFDLLVVCWFCLHAIVDELIHSADELKCSFSSSSSSLCLLRHVLESETNGSRPEGFGAGCRVAALANFFLADRTHFQHVTNNLAQLPPAAATPDSPGLDRFSQINTNTNRQKHQYQSPRKQPARPVD
ncbi:hypothetical protein QBC47DRAFT_365802 [Echria macrotheca]|uniref:Secreted protein n=1 Tax=Echria macrotheca TaxID=438768 RepID=A0AAJ0B205_9PEZI|nr:hypothetical protein QBC47DRAFT_365802 [Echria macrotheca]